MYGASTHPRDSDIEQPEKQGQTKAIPLTFHYIRRHPLTFIKKTMELLSTMSGRRPV